MRRLLPVLVLLPAALGLFPGRCAAAEPPSFELDGERRLVLARLPPILGDEEVRPHLTKGLTVTFLVRVEPRGGNDNDRGGARVEVRYDLWDEVFHTAASGLDGHVERRELASFDELAAWWRGLRLVVLPASREEEPARQARVTLEMLPFSRAEQRDTQRWFSESLDEAGRSGTEELAPADDRPAAALERTLHLLMATSIERRALVVHRFTLPLPTDPGASP